MMKQARFIVLVVLVLLALQMIPAQAYPVGSFSAIYEGVEYATASVSSPRLMKAFAIRIDTQNPYIAMLATPGNGGLPYETTVQNTQSFLLTYQLKAAVNASFFNLGLTPNTDVLGLLVSNGNVVSAPNAYPFNSWVSVTSSNVASIGTGSSIPPGAFNAVGGAELLMTGGVNGNDPNPNAYRDPLTCMGLSQDNRYLILLCVDGRQPGWSDGATYWDMAEFMLAWGGYAMVKMDGGGSTTMVRALNGQAVVCNSPSGGLRSVGSNFGVYSSDLVNPPYTFDSGSQHWYLGSGTGGMGWTNGGGWPGIIYFDQIGADAWIQSGSTNFAGSLTSPQCLSVSLCPGSSTTSAHDMQVFWKTAAEPYSDSAKSSPIVNYTAANGTWATINVPTNNNKWWGQTISQLRLDFDNANYGTRYHVSHIVSQNWIRYDFASNTLGWTGGNSTTAPAWEGCCGWPGVLYTDQTGNDAYIYGPVIPAGGGFPFHYLGGNNDKIHVRVYPQGGNTASHDMRVYWTCESDGSWSQSKSAGVNYTAQNQWADVIIPVGTNSNWAGKQITQLRLDFDDINHGNRWIVDYVSTEY